MRNSYEQFMNRPLLLRSRIEHKAEDVAFKLEVCLKATTALGGERVQTSRDNATERNLVEYIDAKKKLDKIVADYNEAVDEVTSFLYESLDFKYADLLEWKYINGKELSEIAEISGIAYQTARHRSSAAERIAREKFSTYKNSKEQQLPL